MAWLHVTSEETAWLTLQRPDPLRCSPGPSRSWLLFGLGREERRACVRQWWEKKSERKKFRVISEIKPTELWINWVSGQKGDRGLESCQVSGFYSSLDKVFKWPTVLEGRTGDLGGGGSSVRAEGESRDDG